MTSLVLAEWLGYGASFMVAISLMMKNVFKLRILNGVGALLFVISGVMISAWPVAGMNLFIVGINIYYLWQMRPSLKVKAMGEAQLASS